MTRFARARGAAASNERIEEEATPWHQMAQQVRSANGCNRVNLNKGSRDIEDLDGDMVISPDTDNALDIICEQQNNDLSVEDQEQDSSSDESRNEDTGNGKLENMRRKNINSNDSEQAQEDTKGNKKKRQRKQDKCLNCKQKGHLKRDCPELTDERRKELQELVQMKIERKGKGTGRKKNKRKNLGENEKGDENVSSKSKEINHEKFGKNHNRLYIQKSSDLPKHNTINKDKKQLTDKTGQIVGTGEGLFQGFRVKAQDVKRLQKLQKQLKIDKTVTKEDVDATLKRERRKAERELAKFNKMVCFNCRKPGHVLIDCPDTELSDSKTRPQQDGKSNTHCFKCGDKNHTSKECVSKLKGADAYKFAVCFICKRVGHLAKSCPDNPKGLYPKGGGCRLCGSVEHLKADCARKAEKDKRQEVSLSTITMHNKKVGIEEVEIPSLKTNCSQPIPKKAKIVSF